MALQETHPTAFLKFVEDNQIKEVRIFNDEPDDDGKGTLYNMIKVGRKEHFPEQLKNIKLFLDECKGQQFYLICRTYVTARNVYRFKLVIPHDSSSVSSTPIQGTETEISVLEELEELREKVKGFENHTTRRSTIISEIINGFIEPFRETFDTAIDDILGQVHSDIQEKKQLINSPQMAEVKEQTVSNDQIHEACSTLIELFGADDLVRIAELLKENPYMLKKIKKQL